MRHIWSPFKKFNTTYFHNTRKKRKKKFSSPRFFSSPFLSAFFHESCRRRRHAPEMSLLFMRDANRSICFQSTIQRFGVRRLLLPSSFLFFFLFFFWPVRGEQTKVASLSTKLPFFMQKSNPNTVIAVSIIITSGSHNTNARYAGRIPHMIPAVAIHSDR